MDPVAQTLAQAQSGSAGGAGFAQFFAEGVSAAQRQLQIGLAQQRLVLEQQQAQQENQLFPYKLLEQKQRSQLNELNLTIGQQQLREQVENTQALGEVSGLVGNALKSGETQKGFEAALDTAAKHPQLWRDPRFKTLLDELNASEKTASILEQRKAMQDVREQALSLKEQELELKKQKADAGPPPTTAQKNAKALSDLRAAIRTETDPQKKADLQQQMVDLQSGAGSKSGLSIPEDRFVSNHLNTLMTAMENDPANKGRSAAVLARQATTALQTIYRTVIKPREDATANSPNSQPTATLPTLPSSPPAIQSPEKVLRYDDTSGTLLK